MSLFFQSKPLLYSLLLFLIHFCHHQRVCDGQNVDTESPSLFYEETLAQDPSTSTMFGHSVLMHDDDDTNGAMFVIGAPNSTDFIRTSDSVPVNGHANYGRIFHCPVSNRLPFQSRIGCSGIDLFEQLKSYSSKLFTENMRLGWNLIRRSRTKELLTCPFSRTNNVQFRNADGRLEYWPVPNGACFLITEDSIVFGDRPTTTDRPYGPGAKLIFPMQGEEQSNNDGYLLAYGMAGISAAFSPDENAVFMGAPGYYNWKGAVAYAELTNQPTGKPSVEYDIGIRSWPANEKDTYLGYSVSAGQYFGPNWTFIVSGAPRRNLLGSIFVFEKSENHHQPPVMMMDGQQLGEYFGHSLLTVDVNQDGFDDLLVSAPMYSSLQRHLSDEGRVFLFLSTGTKQQGFRRPILLHGDRKPLARFGTAMAHLGDINQDGFSDVVIGAPYEDDFKGTIYIYRGSSTGLVDQYSQRISALEHLASINLKGFGYSFSANVDIDSNHFPDIMVGAYLSTNALLLRTRPIITIQPSIQLKQDFVDLNEPCSFPDEDLALVSGKRLSCVRCKYCFLVTSPMEQSLSKISLMASLKLDEQFNRAFVIVGHGGSVLSNGSNGYSLARVVRQQFLLIPPKKDYCSDYYLIYMKETARIHNLIDPIRLDLEYSIEHDREIDLSDPQQKFHVPMLSDSRTNITAEVDIHLCNKPAIDCRADLILNVGFYFDDDPHRKIFANHSRYELIEGEQRLITLNVQVRNRGEPSFQTMVIIGTERNATTVQFDKRCQMLNKPPVEQNTQTFSCRLDDPLFQMDSVNLTFNGFQVEDTAIVRFRGEISNYNQKSDHASYEVRFKMIKKSEIVLKTIPVHYSMDKRIPPFRSIQPQLNQTIQLQRFGPSSIDKIEIDMIYPNSYDGNEIISDILAKAIDNHVKLECDQPKFENQSSSSSSSWSSSIYTQTNSSHKLVILDCSKPMINCFRKRCHLGPLKVMPNNHRSDGSIHGSIFVRLNIVANVASIQNKFNWNMFPNLIISIQLEATINDKANDNSGMVKHDQISIHWKQFQTEGPSYWWYVLAVIIGLLIMSMVICLLYKCGFFQRDTTRNHQQSPTAEE